MKTLLVVLSLLFIGSLRNELLAQSELATSKITIRVIPDNASVLVGVEQRGYFVERERVVETPRYPRGQSYPCPLIAFWSYDSAPGEKPVRVDKTIIVTPGQDTTVDLVSSPTPVINYGVNINKISKKPLYTIDGDAVSRETVVNELSKELVDDSKKPWLTVFGSFAMLRAVKNNIDQTELTSLCRVNYLPLASWQARTGGFITPADPTVQIQDANGESWARWTGNKSAQELQVVVSALRKPRLDYDPSADINPFVPKPPPPPAPVPTPTPPVPIPKPEPLPAPPAPWVPNPPPAPTPAPTPVSPTPLVTPTTYTFIDGLLLGTAVVLLLVVLKGKSS